MRVVRIDICIHDDDLNAADIENLRNDAYDAWTMGSAQGVRISTWPIYNRRQNFIGFGEKDEWDARYR